MLDFKFLQEIRHEEISWVRSLIGNPPARLLEIGAGSGWQAKYLSEQGYDVSAVDVAGSVYEATREYPVTIYDGVCLPFQSSSFDVVFSSNVLEHVPHVAEFQREILRVVIPGGRAIHVLPTPVWRFWTSATHYPYALGEAWKLVYGRFHRAEDAENEHRKNSAEPGFAAPATGELLRLLQLFSWGVAPRRHGERGNVISELWLYGEHSWTDLFRRNGWVVERCVPNRLFYTGHSIFGRQISINNRRLLSRFFGSACKAYILGSPAGIGLNLYPGT